MSYAQYNNSLVIETLVYYGLCAQHKQGIANYEYFDSTFHKIRETNDFYKIHILSLI